MNSTNQHRASSLTVARAAVDVSSAGQSPLVERPAPGKAPAAFRIWAHGPIEVDGETFYFTRRSARLLLAEQRSRGRLYSFDFDHRSLLSDVSPEAASAAGWHRLEVRYDRNGNPELWAVSCEWTDEARAGLEARPPRWRYFSPCFEVDPSTQEIVSYTNCALTNNPRTHGIPALASAAPRSASSGRLAQARARVAALVARAKLPASKTTAAGRSASAFERVRDLQRRAAGAGSDSALERIRALQRRAAGVRR